MNRTLVATIGVVLAVLACPAYAGTTIDISDLYSAAASTIQTVVVSIILLGLGWLGFLLHKKFGIDIDLAHNTIAQNMAQNLASRLVALGKNATDGKQIDVKSEIVVNLVNEFKTALPGVMSRFGLTDDQIAKMILGKLPPTTPPASPAQ